MRIRPAAFARLRSENGNKFRGAREPFFSFVSRHKNITSIWIIPVFMRLRSRSLRRITGRRCDFHAFARTHARMHAEHAERSVHHAHACVRARIHRDGQIGAAGRRRRGESEPRVYTRRRSSGSYCKAVALVTLEFLAERIPLSCIPRYAIGTKKKEKFSRLYLYRAVQPRDARAFR